MAMKLEETVAFTHYLRNCRTVHEMRHPGAKIDENYFVYMAKTKWSQMSDDQKRSFHAFKVDELR